MVVEASKLGALAIHVGKSLSLPPSLSPSLPPSLPLSLLTSLRLCLEQGVQGGENEADPYQARELSHPCRLEGGSVDKTDG